MLLCGVIVRRPEDPLKFLEEKLREIMEKGLDAVLWLVYTKCLCVCSVVYSIELGLLNCDLRVAIKCGNSFSYFINML